MRTFSSAALRGLLSCAVYPISVVAVALAGLLISVPATAQDTAADDEDTIEEIQVFGTRRVIQNTINIKRNSTQIVDGLSAADIGDLPALSIGEALETITGVASHRENGGATEVSIRGLGPFLSTTTFNGRDATNGSGDRSVNFSQFPSELMNKLVIYKTQNASLVEGGVAGLIWLETLKPLDYNSRRFQVSAKASMNPDQQNVDSSLSRDFGNRITLSYVDQFDISDDAKFGLSLGYQTFDSSAPESEVRSSSPSGTSRYACINEPNALWEGFYRTSTGDCEDQVSESPYPPIGDPEGNTPRSNQGWNTGIDPDTGLPYSDGLAWAFAPSSRGYRQNDTSDERDAFFAAFQFQPNDKIDINLDVQASERIRKEHRQDLNFANQKRTMVGVTGPSLVVSRTGAISNWLGQTALESNSTIWQRDEDYLGGGLAIDIDLTDRFTLFFDASYSKTDRTETEIQIRTQSDDQDIYGNSTPANDSDLGDGGYRPLVGWNLDTGIPQYTIYDFDVNNHALFSDEYRVRIDNDLDRVNKISALRADFELRDFTWEPLASLQGGIRLSELEYLDLGGNAGTYSRYTSPNLDDSSQEERDAIIAINEACRNNKFPESGFLSNVRSGNLVTVIDSTTGEASSGTGNTWATFNPRCMVDSILGYHGVDFAFPDLIRKSPGTVDVTETTLAAYLMANYETEWFGKLVTGNIGVRVVQTDIKSVGYRSPYEIITNSGGFLEVQPVPNADLERVVAEDDYTEVLPSFNLVMDLSDEVIMRAGIFRSISRPDPSDLGYNRSLENNDEEDVTDINEVIGNVRGAGNPFTRPLPSWNFDLGLEWYPDDDSILAAAVYAKQFTGGFEPTRNTETFIVDGQPVPGDYTALETRDDTSELYGIEITGAYRFSGLPGAWSGLGTKVSYNYAHSDFQFEDSQYGAFTVLDNDGNVFSQTARIVEPGNVPGFSEHVFSGQLYWDFAKWDLQLIYKYRSEYFQPYTSNGTRLRYVGDVGVWEARAAYRIRDNVTLTLEGINILDEEKTQYFFVRDDLGEVNSYGPRYFFGLRAKW